MNRDRKVCFVNSDTLLIQIGWASKVTLTLVDILGRCVAWAGNTPVIMQMTSSVSNVIILLIFLVILSFSLILISRFTLKLQLP